MTAEAIAEHLRRPLYVVSAGELGILPQVLETQLRNILEVSLGIASSCNLLPEANEFAWSGNVCSSRLSGTRSCSLTRCARASWACSSALRPLPLTRTSHAHEQADIFLQKRDANHLERNALTGVFLRCEAWATPSLDFPRPDELTCLRLQCLNTLPAVSLEGKWIGMERKEG